MASDPDLTRELDEAEAIVTGRAETIMTEWGCRNPAGAVFEYRYLGEEAARRIAERCRLNGSDDVLVRRAVTYGPWEPVSPEGEAS